MLLAMTLVSRRLLASGLLAGLGCHHDEAQGDESGAYEQGVDTPASARPPASTCPEGAPVLGSSGPFERVELPWDSNGAQSYLADYLYFVVPDDILSLLIAVEHGAEYTALNSMAIDGEPMIDLLGAIGEPPFYHWPVEVASVAMPISEETVPRGSCLAVDPVVYADVAGQTGVLHLVSRRGPAQPSAIAVNVFVVGDTAIAEADAMAAVARMGEVYVQGGAPAIGDVAFSTIEWPRSVVDSEGQEPDELRALTAGAEPAAISLLFVQDFTEVGTLGIAAGIPGPNGVSGTAASAVMISVDSHLDGDGATLLTDLMGETMAHEIGHQIGLYHTTESDGLYHDPIDDTPECGVEYDDDGDGELFAEECEAVGGRNFMFWTAAEAFGQFEMSPTQAKILRDSVIARPQ